MISTSLLSFIGQPGFDTSNNWVFIPQIVSALALLWFAYHTGHAFLDEIKTSHAREQGAMPILGFLYMTFSIYFIFQFILNFGVLRSFNEFKLRNSLNSLDESYWYILFINILTSLILIGFTLNFSKALLTLTSLEFGTLGDQNLGTFLNIGSSGVSKRRDKFKPYVEMLLRLFIAFCFILIEKKLFEPSGEILSTVDRGDPNYRVNGFLSSLGWRSLLLYFFLFSWLSIFYWWLDRTRKLSKAWYKIFYWQFVAGMVVSLFLLFFSCNPQEEYKIALIGLFGVGIVAAAIIIVTIFISEYRRLFTSQRTAAASQINGNTQSV